MKYAILNCWTDFNKGDLGIVISTIDEIRRQDAKSEIIGISCFSQNDKYFFTCHDTVKEYLDGLYPAIFGVLVMTIGKFTTKHILFKLIVAIFETLRMILAIILPKYIAINLLSNFEKKTLSEIRTCDISIAKGGSVFNEDGSFRGKFALFRICMFYFLLNKYNCSYYILGQSFGPVHDKISSWLINKVIKNAEKTYLREWICVQKYNSIFFPNNKIGFSNDTAFLLKQQKINSNICDLNFNIGLTVRPANKEMAKYVTAIRDTIIYYVDKHNAYFHIFPQVSGDNEPDDKMAKDIYDQLSGNYKNHVILYSNNYTPQQLKYMYSRMKFFIGTRLHSTIFAMGAGTPSIGLVYHGTKAQGIFKNMEVSDLIITDINAKKIIEKSEYILENYSSIKEKLDNNVTKAIQQTAEAVNEIILKSKER